jgi:hypothetical protein
MIYGCRVMVTTPTVCLERSRETGGSKRTRRV